MKKQLPIGVSDFKEMIDDNLYYIDKSLFITDIIDSAKVSLLARPRRFGKTLNLSLLRYFFEKTDEDRSYLFEGLEIERAGARYLEHQGRYPVIFITFKDLKEVSWVKSYQKIKFLISTIFKEYDYLLDGDCLDPFEKSLYRKILTLEADDTFYEESLKILSQFLHRYHKEKVIILIDEYDAPIQQGYLNSYYSEVINFIRNFLSGGLKDNRALKKGVLTGILRVDKESIFSGLNNLSVYSLLSEKFNQRFGLLEDEVKEILDYYGIRYKIDEIRDWYNGYKFGGKTVYNPWSIINYIEQNGTARPYWVNTSHNNLVRKLITEGKGGLKKDLEDLIKGETITKEIDETITFEEIEKNDHSIWSFLFFSGYLTVEKYQLQGARLYCELRISNMEIKYNYENIILNWFKTSIGNEELDMMLGSLTGGDIKTFNKIFKKLVKSTLSYFDTGGREPEKFYHAFVLGLLVNLRDGYQVLSNRESGYGRYDVCLIPYNVDRPGIIFEFKKLDPEDEDGLESAVDNALKQIDEQKYSQQLQDRGISQIIKLGIAFSGKEVMIKEGKPR